MKTLSKGIRFGKRIPKVIEIFVNDIWKREIFSFWKYSIFEPFSNQSQAAQLSSQSFMREKRKSTQKSVVEYQLQKEHEVTLWSNDFNQWNLFAWAEAKFWNCAEQKKLETKYFSAFVPKLWVFLGLYLEKTFSTASSQTSFFRKFQNVERKKLESHNACSKHNGTRTFETKISHSSEHYWKYNSNTQQTFIENKFSEGSHIWKEIKISR